MQTPQGDWAEVWPALGFNAIAWHVLGESLLYSDPNVAREFRPTRSGNPILFPFPNRIRDGRFSWKGTKYALPLGDSTGKNAIHGFACHVPWRVVDHGANSNSTWITGEFQGTREVPEKVPLWPSDFGLRLTYRLGTRRLAVEAEVFNPSSVDLPFGLGYHPYFRLEPFGGEEAIVWAMADEYWPLQENLPAGTPTAVDASRDFRDGKVIRDLAFDDVLTSLETGADLESPMGLLGEVRHPSGRKTLQVWGDRAFRELVVFTPPHRQAVCLEPYTCVTDAINLQQQGVDAGWRVLGPGQTWRGDVVYAMHRP